MKLVLFLFIRTTGGVVGSNPSQLLLSRVDEFRLLGVTQQLEESGAFLNQVQEFGMSF